MCVCPEPQGVFPRYVEPETDDNGGPGAEPKPKQKATKKKA